MNWLSHINLSFSTNPKSHRHDANVFSGCRMIEYYREHNGRCILPQVSPAQEGTKIVLQKSCEGEEFLFCYGYDERIYHAQTNLCLVQVGIKKLDICLYQ